MVICQAARLLKDDETENTTSEFETFNSSTQSSATSPGTFTLSARLPPAGDIHVDGTQTKYLHFFLENFSFIFPMGHFIPSFGRDLLVTAMHHDALFNALILVSSYHTECLISEHNEHTISLVHHQRTVNVLQQRLANGVIDDGLCAGILLLAYYNLVNGMHKYTLWHLRGLFEALSVKRLRRDDFEFTALEAVIYTVAARMDLSMVQYTHFYHWKLTSDVVCHLYEKANISQFSNSLTESICCSTVQS